MPSPRKSSLGWITQSDPPIQPRLEKLTAEPSEPSQVSVVIPPTVPQQEMQPVLPELESPLNVDIPARLHSRLHSVVGWDEERRSMKQIVTLILEEGLAKFPDKGPAPPSYLARLKSFGKRKTQKS